MVRSYWTWAILLTLIICIQGLGAGEKLWIKVWGDVRRLSYIIFERGLIIFLSQAYKVQPSFSTTSTTLFSPSSSPAELEGISQGQHPFSSVHLHEVLKLKKPNYSVSSDDTTSTSSLPSVFDHPMFYVAIYSAIGFGSALVSVTSNAIQFTGALRASRKLFKQLLDAVVMATVRFHDTTPAGESCSILV